MAAEGDCASGGRVALAAATEAVAAGWVLELSCCRLCRHFVEGRAAEFRRWRAVAQGEGAPPVPSPSGRGCRFVPSAGAGGGAEEILGASELLGAEGGLCSAWLRHQGAVKDAWCMYRPVTEPEASGAGGSGILKGRRGFGKEMQKLR